MSNNKIIAFLPLRGGSKSIPLKNLKIINAQPLFYWMLKSLQESKVDEIYVATDNSNIVNAVSSLNFSKVKIFNRSTENAQDNSSTESVILEFLALQQFQADDLFILAQATSPLTSFQDINNALELLHATKADSLLSAVTCKRFFWTPEGTSINYDYTKRPRRQDFKGLLMENGAFYINKVKHILTTKNRLSGKIAIYKMPDYTALEIDEDLDFILVEMLLKKYQTN